MLKTSIATLIAALYPRHNYIQDFHVLAYFHRRPVFTCGGRRYGKVYAARQRELIREALQLPAGATLRLLYIRRNQPILGRIVRARGEGKSVECVFKRDPATGDLTLLSAETVERKSLTSPWFYYDEWAWCE